MERFAVCVNDAEVAQRALVPLLTGEDGPTHFVLVACPPDLGGRIGRWLTPAMRRQWREDWAAPLRERLAATLVHAVPGVTFEWVVAQQPLPAVTRELRLRLGAALRLIDARQQRPGCQNPVMTLAPSAPAGRFATPVAVASSLSLLLALTD